MFIKVTLGNNTDGDSVKVNECAKCLINLDKVSTIYPVAGGTTEVLFDENSRLYKLTVLDNFDDICNVIKSVQNV